MLHLRLAEQLKEAQQKIERYVLQGQIPDYATYKFFVGKIRGLQDALDIFENIYKRINDDNND